MRKEKPENRGQKSEDRKRQRIRGKIFVISGPSGSGKTTLLKSLLLNKFLKPKLAKSVSLTTRPKRSGERQGRDYFFVKPEEFRRLKKAKKILEWTRYLGYYYGTKKDFLEYKLKAGKHLALCLDLRGALKIKRLYPGSAVLIFVDPPSINELRKRIKGRCLRTGEEEVEKRLRLAQGELKDSHHYDYIVKNKNFNEAKNRLKDIILKAIEA